MKENRKWGIQLYTVRDFMTTEEDIAETFAKLKKMGYDEAQTAGCRIPYKRFGELAKDAGIEIVGTHDNYDMMVDDFNQSLENHKLLGTTNMGIGGRGYGSLDDVKKFIEQANIIAKKAGENGMKFTYHNHSHEFSKWENGKTTMDMLIEELDKDNTSFVLDTYWVQHAGGDVCSYIERLSGRIDILHLKDMRVIGTTFGCEPSITEIGDGNMDWKKIIETADKCGIKHLVVEQDANWDPNCFAAAKKSINYLKNLK